MSKVKFKYGTAEQLANAPYLEGTFYVISDDNSTDGILYADLHGNRICFGDVASLVKKVSKLESSAQDTKFEVDWLRSNIIKNTTERDTTITADDAHTVPPQEVVIYGKSEQNGTPTPITPISIDSLDNKFTLHVAKNGITDYGDWPIMFDLGSYILRSLPDGTCDTLRMSYSKPSEDAGWAMYDTTLEQTIASIALADLEWTQLSNGIFQGKNIPNSANGIIGTHQILCDTYQEIETQSNSADMIGNDDKTIAFQSDYPYIFVKDTDYTNLDDFIASLGTSVINYPLATPIVHSLETVEFLGTVELPVLPNPMTAWVDDGNVQPDISMTYEVDNKIFSSNLIHAETDVSLDDIRDRINALENIDEILTNRLIATEADIDSLEVTKANIDSLEAAEARIDELEVSSATIQNLEATNARIGDLETDNLAVKRRLTAAEADIGNLEAVNVNVIGRLRATEADIEELTASKATVDDLIAVNANIQELEAANATITGKLTAAEASIEDLEAENATITGTLTAAQASIEDLEATNATITGRLEANEASIEDLEAANVTITGRLEANEADIDTLTASKADITDLNAATARIGSLETDNVDVKGRLSATEADIENLEATTATIENLNAAEARIGTLETDKANVTDLTAATGRIGTLEANTADIATIRANSAKVANLTAQELEADHATIGSLDANYAQINMANVNNAWIQNGTVKDGAISNAMINSVSANKLTAGTIDASNITVTNLNADNITTGTINGQRIGAGSLSLDKLEENVYTEDEVNSIVDNLQNQIDGAIETWTGTEIPTLSNTPASDWTTNSIKDKHVGDIYFIVNSQSDQNGYNYRFTKIGNTYSWQLIKDSDVTQVLQRLTDAEGKIGDIEQFDTTISSWKNDTDEELSSIKSAATTLAGRVTTAEGTLQTKVDTTTFNTLSQTVDGHSSSITQLTTETSTLTQAVDTLNTKTSSDSGNVIQFSDSIGFKEIVVHGKSTQASYTGKNLLDTSVDPIAVTSANATHGVDYVTVTSTSSTTWSYARYRLRNVEALRDQSVTLSTITSNSTNNRVGIEYYDESNARISYKTVIGSYLTVTIPETTSYIDVLFYARTTAAGNIGDACTYSNIQLELGSTATDYEPYVGGKPSPNPEYPQEINSIDNLTLHVRGFNIWDEEWEVGGYNGTTGAKYPTNDRIRSKNVVSILSSTTYYFKCPKNFNLYYYDANDGFVSTEAYSSVGGIGNSFTTPANAHHMRFAIQPTYGTTYNNDICINVSDTSSNGTYAPYQGQSIDIPLGDHQIRSLPDGTEDTLTFSYIGPSIREGWGLYNTELVQKINIEIFDGSESGWTKSTGYPGGYYLNAWAYTRGITSSNKHIQDHFITANNLSAYSVGTCLFDNSLNFRLDNTEIATLNDFKSWLSENPVTVQYVLVTPITHSLGVVELPFSENLNLWATTSPFTTIDATWWHEPGRVEKNEIDISLTASNLGNAIDSTTLSAPYTEVEWVESNGMQYVYLDWKPPIATWGFEADFIIRNAFSSSVGAWNPNTNVNGYGNVFGTRNASMTNDIQLGTYSTNGAIRWGQTGYSEAGLLKKDKTRQQVSLKGTTLTKADGTTATIIRSTEIDSKFYANMAVFCMHEGLRRSATGGVVQPGSVRIYSLKFYDGDDLKVDLVGALRNSDGMTGLYDKVKGHFYPAYGMTYGNEVGDLGTPDTILEAIAKSKIVANINNRQIARMWRVEIPELNRLEDGQKISVTFSTAVSGTTPVAAGLVGWDETATTSYSNVFLQIILGDGTETEWIPCFYGQGNRLTTHYGSGTPILLTYRENVLYNSSATNAGTAVMRAWYADPNYADGNTTYTKYSNSVVAGLNGIKRYTLCMKDQNGKWTSIINQANTVAATKTCYTGGLQLDTILYYSPANEIAAGNNSSDGLWESYGIIDWRYSFNVENNATNGLAYRTPLYLVGTLNNSDGLFYLDTTKWWTQTPNDSTKIYIWVSAGYTNYYQGILSVQNTIYAYDEDAGLVEINVSRYTRTATKLNETIDTVDEHTRKIGVLETTVENKADGSDLTTISNRLNTVSDTVDGHTQSISSLNSTMATKADSSSVETISNRVNSISDTVDGHTQSISSINSTVATKADSSTVTTLSNNVNSISETVDGHTQSISSLNTTVATKADGSALTTVSNKVNTISDTVDEHSQSISSINTTLDTKADGSALTTVSNKLNTVSDTVDGHTQSISSINETLETKVDSSTVSSLTTKVNNISDTVDGHTQTIGSVQNTQTQMQGKLNKTIVETTQLWYSKANTEAPAKPTSQITSTSTDGNAWRIVVPVYNASYPNYFYCYQWKYTDGTYGWSGVTRDIATGESQERARTAITDASSAVSTAASAQATAESASTNANQAKENASSAVSLANTASTNASSALSTANTASSNASTALSTANSAASDASSAVSTANTAKATADKNVKTSLQLWFTKANETAPNKPTTRVTSTSTDGNAWRVVVPTYSVSYPYYFYCYQYELADGTYTWSDVVYDRATTENQSNSRNAVTGVSTLTTKTNTISDTVDQHSQSISSLNTTVATKADNSTVTTLSNNLSTLEQDVNTFKTTVSSTYSTKNELAEVQDDISDLQAGSKLSDTKSGNIIVIDDALAAPPIDITVYGKSTQTGTPTPDAPIEIQSVDDLTLHVCGKNLCGTITDHPDGKRFYGYGVNSVHRYPKLACDLPAGTYTLSMDVRSIESAPVTCGNIRIWARDATDGIIYDPYISTGTKGQQTAGGVVLGVGGYYDNIPTTFTHVSAIINLGFPVSELIFGCYNSGKYIEYQNLQLEYGDTATAYTPYVGQSVKIPLSNHIARSLPDGTRDTLTLSYIGPSEREGWAWYSKKLMQHVGELDLGTLNWLKYSSHTFYANISTIMRKALGTLCTAYKWKSIGVDGLADGEYSTSSGGNTYVWFRDDAYDDAASFKSGVSGVMFDYILATPITKTLDSIELPILPDSDVTIWASSAVVPTLDVEYWLNNAADIVPHLLDLDAVSKNNITAIESRVHTAESTIDQHSDSIALKANSSDVYTKTETNGLIATEASNRQSAIEQSAEQISLNVSQTYTTKTEFNNLELGGRNYALNSEFVCDRSLYGGNEYFAYDLGRALPFGEGTPIVISFDLYMEVVTSGADLFIVYNTNNKGPHQVIIDTRPFQGRTISVGDIINERVVIVKTVRRDRTDANKDHDWLEFYTGYGSGNLFKITNLKLEKGTKVTDWTPAPEDEVVNRNAAIDLATDAIELSVKETYASKKQLGSRNLVETTAITSGYLATNGGIQAAGATFKEFTSDYIPVSSDKPMIFQYWVSVTGTGTGDGAGWMAYGFYDSNKSWLSSPGRFAKYSGLSNTPTAPVPWHGVYEINDIPSGAAYIRVSWRELTDGIVKLERRDDSDANISYQVEEAKAAIKVTTDGISTEVAKKVGVSEVISKINQSAESVKIQASKVEIDGTAIFTNSDFQSQLSNQNYATTGQVATAKSEAISAAATDATNKAATAEQNAKTYAEGQASTVNSSLEAYKSSTNLTLTALQNQVDGQIEAWYKSTDPTTSNEPASTWNTDALKARHEGDIYYNVENGHSWRWMKSGNTYSWQQIPDSDAAAALAAAQNAQTLANSKRRIFTSTPTPPYDIGDLWVDGTSVKYCSTSKSETQTYAESDWTLTATDDTLAQNALDAAGVVQDNLNAARTWYAECNDAAATVAKVATITPTTEDFVLTVGSVVYIKFAITNSAAVASITLNVNDTGAKRIQYTATGGGVANLPAVGYLAANRVYQFIYDGTYWVLQYNFNSNDNTVAYYVQYRSQTKMLEATPNACIIVGTSAGYKKAAAGITFDIAFPILWSSTAVKINNNANSAYIYTTYPDANLATSHSSDITDGVAAHIVYLKCTIQGSIATIATSPFLTCTEPTSEDGYIYIPIGRLGGNSTGKNYLFYSIDKNLPLHAYVDGAFRQVDTSTIIATQKLYYRTTSLTAPTAPTTWITTNNVATYDAWNLAVPPLATSIAENATKYPYLYSVEQQKRVDGTIVTSEVSNDSNTTIIDGGSIITNSVTATQIAAGTITANEISSGAITTDKLDANAVTAAKIDATDLHVSAANIDGTITFGQLSGVQASGDYALNSAIPTKVSDLTNDSEFQTSSQVDATITSKNYATQTALNTEINQRKAQYGTSSTAAGTAAKVVTCANFELEVGNEITVKFTTANTSAAKVQLNVNSKGAKDIWVGNAVTSASNQLLWGADAYITFKYDGTQFQVIGEPRTWYGGCTTAQATAAKAATITGCVVCKGAKVELAMTYANSAASPTLNISSVGAKNIYFGTGTTQPLISNGTSWLQSNTATFTFDGAVWRTQGKTYIDANSIVTGYISADRIEAGSISGDKITGGTLAIGAFPSTTQADILNSNIHVPSTVAELEDSSDYATKTYAEEYAEEYADGKDSAIAAAAKRTDVSIAVTAINYTNNTATLQATLYIDGTATTSGVTYKWLKDGTVISGQTSRTLSVTSAMGLSHVYSCTVTYS